MRPVPSALWCLLVTDHALILLAHGSPEPAANHAMHRLADRLGRATGARQAVAAFLRHAAPSLPEAAAELARQGARCVLIVPYFAMTGVHQLRDLPRMTAELAARYPQLQIQVTRGLEDHPGVVKILEERVRETLGDTNRRPQPSSDIERHEHR